MKAPSNSGHSKLQGKSELLRREFNLPSSADERVLQDYRCTLAGTGSGKLYITPNALFFFRSPQHLLHVPLRHVHTVTATDKGLELQGRTCAHLHSFWSLQKRDEALHLAQHLLKHPFTLLSPENNNNNNSSFLGNNNNNNNNSSYSGNNNSSFSVSSDVDFAVDTQPLDASVLRATAVPRVQVDTSAGQRALQSAHRAQELGVATLVELDRQAGVVANMRDATVRMDADLDAANRHLRGIESIGGAIANKMSADKTSPTPPRKLMTNRMSQSVTPPSIARAPECVFEIVYKHDNDSLTLGKITFAEKEFTLTDGGQIKETLTYDQVDSIVCRARPLHCDLIFKGSATRRSRFVSSHQQLIVNEFALRCGSPTRPLGVVFEQNSYDFRYNLPSLRKYNDALAKLTRNDPSYEHLPPEIAAGLRMQDKQLDDIEQAAKTLEQMGIAIGEEVEHSTKEIKDLTREVEGVHGRIVTTNHRVERLL